MSSNFFNGFENQKKLTFSLSSLENELSGLFKPFLLIVLFAVVVYSNTYNNPFIFDDFGVVLNPVNDKFLDIPALWNFYSSRMVTFFTFTLNYFIHGPVVTGYHIVNLLIHIINGILFFMVFRTILGTKYFCDNSMKNFKHIICLLSSILFIVHPINTIAVTFIWQRFASLAAMFMLFSIYFYLKFRISKKIIFFILTIVFIVIAMFTKENTAIIPIIILLIEFLFLKKDYVMKKITKAVVIILLLITILIIPSTTYIFGGHSQNDTDSNYKSQTEMTRVDYLTTQINVVSRYTELILIPDNQVFDYENEFPKSYSIFQNNTYISLIFILITFLMGLLCLKNNRLISLGIFWYYLGLSVESSIIPIKDIYFEQRLYFPCIGFVIFLVGIFMGCYKIFKNKISFQKPLLFFLVFCIFMIPLYSSLTIKRNYLFSNEILLWSDVVKKVPNGYRSHLNLGRAYLYKYQDTKSKNDSYLFLAENEYLKASRRDNNPVIQAYLAKIYLLQKRYEKCVSFSKNVVKKSKNPLFYYTLASAYEGLKDYPNALKNYLIILNINKNDCEVVSDLYARNHSVLLNIADTYFKLRDYKNAKSYYKKYFSFVNTSKEKDYIKNKIRYINKIISE